MNWFLKSVMKHPRWALPAFLLAACVLLAQPAQAYLASQVTVMGTISDFDEHYLYLDAKVERYRIKRSAVPDAMNLKPGKLIMIQVPFAAFRIVPATAPIAVPHGASGASRKSRATPHVTSRSSSPRKRTPAQD